MRHVVVSLAFLLVFLVPAASADRFTGSLAAESIYVQGPTSAKSAGLLTRLGGPDTSFDRPPVIALAGERVAIEQRVKHYTYLNGIEADNPVGSGVEGGVLSHAVASLDAWLSKGDEIVIHTKAGSALAYGLVAGDAGAPTPLATNDQDVNWSVADSGNSGVKLEDPYRFTAEAGWLKFHGPEFTRQVDYAGDFVVHIYGADLRINHDGGARLLESGHRIKEGAAAGESWRNVTTLHVHSGHLTIDPNSNVMTAYAPNADIAGTGSVFLREATGLLKSTDRGTVGVDAQDLNLLGAYQLSVRGSTRGLLASVAGDFESSLLGFAATTVSGTSGAWWWLVAAVALVAAGGTGGVLLVRRRSASAPVPVAPVVAVAEASQVDPDFAWDEINEEFGVIHAGEKSGLLIVLVPEDRVQPFLHAVVARGLMAEDTGDRVHAGENTLAVIALEPSPLMMN